MTTDQQKKKQQPWEGGMVSNFLPTSPLTFLVEIWQGVLQMIT